MLLRDFPGYLGWALGFDNSWAPVGRNNPRQDGTGRAESGAVHKAPAASISHRGGEMYQLIFVCSSCASIPLFHPVQVSQSGLQSVKSSFVQLQKPGKAPQDPSAFHVWGSSCCTQLQLPQPILHLPPAPEQGISASLHLLAGSELPQGLHGEIHQVF